MRYISRRFTENNTANATTRCGAYLVFILRWRATWFPYSLTKYRSEGGGGRVDRTRYKGTGYLHVYASNHTTQCCRYSWLVWLCNMVTLRRLGKWLAHLSHRYLAHGTSRFWFRAIIITILMCCCLDCQGSLGKFACDSRARHSWTIIYIYIYTTPVSSVIHWYWRISRKEKKPKKKRIINR